MHIVEFLRVLSLQAWMMLQASWGGVEIDDDNMLATGLFFDLI
jgi:hypothetical protein